MSIDTQINMFWNAVTKMLFNVKALMKLLICLNAFYQIDNRDILNLVPTCSILLEIKKL